MLRKDTQMNLESLGPGAVKECLLNINQHVLNIFIQGAVDIKSKALYGKNGSPNYLCLRDGIRFRS